MIVEKDGQRTSYKSPCFGAVGISRISGQAKLFNSEIVHDSYIKLTIKNASLERSYHNGYLHASGVPHIEVAMSHAQFAEMITTQNIGCGTPCTIERFNGNKIPYEQIPPIQDIYSDESIELNKQYKNSIDSAVKMVEENLSTGKPLNKKKQEDLLHNIQCIARNIQVLGDFSANCFKEEMETQVTNAKSEISAYYDLNIRQAGIHALQNVQQDIKKIENK